MSVKKFLVLSAAGIAALAGTAAQAGGPDVMAAPAPVDVSGFYIDVDAGWARSRWANFLGGAIVSGPTAPADPTITSGGNGGFTWGGDIGYQFTHHFAAELGWYDLPTLKGNQTFVAVPIAATNPPAQGVKVRSWFTYLAGKLSIPLFDTFDLFGKAGVALRQLKYTTGTDTTVLRLATSGNYWAPFFGLGGQWWITHAWSANIQYLHVAGNGRNAQWGNVTAANDTSNQAPSANLVLAGIGYKFAI